MGSVMTCKENPCCGDMLNCRLPDPFPPESRKPALEAALSASPAAQTEDWVLVPREPTEAMKAAVRANGGIQAVAYALAAWPDFLAATPSAPQPTEPVAVKPLEWEEFIQPPFQLASPYYFIGHRQPGLHWVHHRIAGDLRGSDGKIAFYPTTEAAKAAAQADHDARILSSLASPVAQQRDEVWQDIATAPKNRKVLVGYHNPIGKWRTVTACYHTELPWSDDHNPEPDDGEFAPEGWYEESDSAETIYFTACPPTHWRPLPQPPALSPERKDQSNG